MGLYYKCEILDLLCLFGSLIQIDLKNIGLQCHAHSSSIRRIESIIKLEMFPARCSGDLWDSLQLYYVLPPIHKNCRSFCTKLVQTLYYVGDTFYGSEGINKRV